MYVCDTVYMYMYICFVCLIACVYVCMYVFEHVKNLVFSKFSNLASIYHEFFWPN